MIKNNKGSTLVILLIITTILMLLGTTIITLSITNYKMKKINSYVKESFYYAESGLDEALIKTNEIVYESITYANTKVDEEIEKAIEESKKRNENQDNNNKNNKNNKNNNNNNNDLETNEEEILDYDTLNSFFKNYFKQYLGNNLENYLITMKNYRFNSENNLIIKIDENIKYYSSNITFSLTSTYNKNVEKTVSSDFIIDIPNYNETYNNLIKMENFKIIR